MPATTEVEIGATRHRPVFSSELGRSRGRSRSAASPSPRRCSTWPIRSDADARCRRSPAAASSPARGVGQVLHVHVDAVVVRGRTCAPRRCRRCASVATHTSSGTITRASPMPRSTSSGHVAGAAGPSVAGPRPAGPSRAGTCRGGRRRGGPVVAVADAAVEVDARRGHRARRQRERHRGQHQPADRAHERADAGSPRRRAITTIATTVSPPAAAAQAPPIAISPQTTRMPMPSAARLATSPASPPGPSPETNHQTRTPAATRMASGMRMAREDESAAEKKGPGDARAGPPRRRSRASDCGPAARLAAADVLARDQEQRREVGEQARATHEREHDRRRSGR